MTRRARSGDPAPSDRRHVGLTVPRRVRDDMKRAADVLDWSVGDWVLAAAAEHGPSLRERLAAPVRRRRAVEDAVFCALYLTPDERDELDDQATALGLNRSAFVTAVARLALGADVVDLVRALTRDAGREGEDPADAPGSARTP